MLGTLPALELTSAYCPAWGLPLCILRPCSRVSVRGNVHSLQGKPAPSSGKGCCPYGPLYYSKKQNQEDLFIYYKKFLLGLCFPTCKVGIMIILMSLSWRGERQWYRRRTLEGTRSIAQNLKAFSVVTELFPRLSLRGMRRVRMTMTSWATCTFRTLLIPNSLERNFPEVQFLPPVGWLETNLEDQLELDFLCGSHSYIWPLSTWNVAGPNWDRL